MHTCVPGLVSLPNVLFPIARDHDARPTGNQLTIVIQGTVLTRRV